MRPGGAAVDEESAVRRSQSLFLPALAVTAALALSACGGSGGDNPTVGSTPGAGGSAAASGNASDPKSLLPADVTKAGTLRAATDGTYPPNEFTGADGKTL